MDSVIGTALIIFTGLCTYMGLKDRIYFDKYKFEVDGILIHKELYRIFSSGFLHANWIHFGFNMFALASFSWSLEVQLGYLEFLLLYFVSLIGGSLLSLLIHGEHGDYSAVGASGAISGVVLASIVLFPEGEIGFIILPFSIKSWIFALLFIAISVWGIKSQSDNIGHEAHLGGGICGVLMTMILSPSVISTKLWIISLILVPSFIFLMFIISRPDILILNKFPTLSLGKKKPIKKRKESDQKTIDDILDKIKSSGMASLSPEEKELLDQLSK